MYIFKYSKMGNQSPVLERVGWMIDAQIFLWPCIHKGMEFFPLKCKESSLRRDFMMGGLHKKMENIQIFDYQN